MWGGEGWVAIDGTREGGVAPCKTAGARNILCVKGHSDCAWAEAICVSREDAAHHGGLCINDFTLDDFASLDAIAEGEAAA